MATHSVATCVAAIKEANSRYGTKLYGIQPMENGLLPQTQLDTLAGIGAYFA